MSLTHVLIASSGGKHYIATREGNAGSSAVDLRVNLKKHLINLKKHLEKALPIISECIQEAEALDSDKSGQGQLGVKVTNQLLMVENIRELNLSDLLNTESPYDPVAEKALDAINGLAPNITA